MSSGYPGGSGSGASHYQPQPSSYHHQSHSSNQQNIQQQQKQHSSASSSMSGQEVFTAEMRDRQARGKDPYTEGDGSDDGEGDQERHEEGGEYDEHGGEQDQDGVNSRQGWHGSDEDDEVSNLGLGTSMRRGNGRLGNEDFAAAERRQTAVTFLNSRELLMMHSLKTGETEAATKLYFMRMLCGFEDDSSSSTPQTRRQTGKPPRVRNW
ncbi:hypothetical protein QBC37DRAFT_377922 [Rhypophila decipiens]|uniref:Uncharacterized protein n=1 Tax=Rhypophila decipiens TaxID=261697 RepID=A0AAN6Y567_9PEZI|nr:hypothetical protein QBC37DRAFT_377922 [Rhypophila decipiens]